MFLRLVLQMTALANRKRLTFDFPQRQAGLKAYPFIGRGMSVPTVMQPLLRQIVRCVSRSPFI